MSTDAGDSAKRIDHYADGAWYDAEYVHIRADIPLYSAVAREAKGPILELACGTGRLTLPMAEAGATVTGVDVEASMLHQAEVNRRAARPEVQARLRFHRGDMRTLALDDRFDRVVLGFNALLHMLEDADLVAVLECGRRHLGPDGRFHLDIYIPYPSMTERDPTGRYDPQQMIDPFGQRWIVTENNRYDPRTQINYMRFYYRPVDANDRPIGAEIYTEIPLRVIFPRELDAFLAQAGLRVMAEFDDYGRTQPYTARAGLRVMELAARP